MPSSEKMMQNFMMGLFGAAPFNPPVTAEESEKYEELTAKLVKTAGAASFSFSQRERLVDRISTKLDDLVQDESTKIDVEGAATLMRTLFNNIVKNPNEQKFRKVNLENKAIQSKLGENASCLGILKSVGFAKSGSELVLAKGKKVINVAPFVVARDCIDKWLLKNRKEMAALARKRKDEVDQARLQAEREAAGEDEEVEEEVVVEEVDPTVCTLKLRLDGKNKVHEVVLHEDDTLSAVLEALGVDADEEATITCVAKRLAMKSTDENAMKKTLREHRLMPAAAIVVKVGAGNAAIDPSSLKDRAAEKKRKKGSHTMQSIGIYAKDDNNKGELVDGGGGTLYEQDVSDDEEEAKAEGDEPAEADADENAEKGEGDEESPDPSIL
jgi:ribosomal protein L12E/L44/L45/RPP1/RPP2